MNSLAGRVGQGLNAGGKAYGYAPALGEKGKRIIVEAEAKIVQRIFEEYVAGRTPREIAYDLNNESISPPRGRSWNASTINGNMQRGTGIIQNELYAGRLVWNKVRMIKDPDTGKRLSRPNVKNEWQTTDVPDLRIISQELFNAAQSRKQARGNTHPNHQRRPRHMLSGLLRCGACGSGMSTNGRDKSERIRIRCSAATKSGVCRDAKTFYLTTVESAVLAGLEAGAPPQNRSLVLNFLQCRLNFLRRNFGEPFQSIPAKQFAILRFWRGDDRAERRLVQRLHAEFLVRESKLESGIGNLAGRVVKHIATQDGKEAALIQCF